MLILEGRVTTGFGVSSEHLAPIADLLRQRAGFATLAPGTLNIRLGAPYYFEPDAEISHAEYGYERLKLQRCCLRGLRAVILRPETHESGNGHGASYLELLGEVPFRAALGLHDDDLVDVVTGHDLACWARRP